jgi:hypothetical protein
LRCILQQGDELGMDIFGNVCFIKFHQNFAGMFVSISI